MFDECAFACPCYTHNSYIYWRRVRAIRIDVFFIAIADILRMCLSNSVGTASWVVSGACREISHSVHVFSVLLLILFRVLVLQSSAIGISYFNVTGLVPRTWHALHVAVRHLILRPGVAEDGIGRVFAVSALVDREKPHDSGFAILNAKSW